MTKAMVEKGRGQNYRPYGNSVVEVPRSEKPFKGTLYYVDVPLEQYEARADGSLWVELSAVCGGYGAQPEEGYTEKFQVVMSEGDLARRAAKKERQKKDGARRMAMLKEQWAKEDAEMAARNAKA